MNAAWILLPVVVMCSSLLFIDRRGAWRWLGVALALAGVAGLATVALLLVKADERAIAECASKGGVPANGECWIDGERR